ncbi:hypothetical protein OS493_005276 [Desmophyllum pertusum]|uniref:Schlafen AlbA-2 domain-containing protein n=1 Tax=Desmophyllum pertusum TaxID=174260 RepID=A0A9W9Z6U9_9CNID|nr:hypothetical protein OS493_005276 [Desmophyllum pertusum]
MTNSKILQEYGGGSRHKEPEKRVEVKARLRGTGPGKENITVEELPPWCYYPGTDRRSRKAVSRNINGFLNTGKGGTIYLGIVDDGRVKGLQMTQYQRDHVRISVKDALSRYTPAVPEEFYKVEIIPIIDARKKQTMHHLIFKIINVMK